MNDIVPFLFGALVVALAVQTWKCVACALYLGPYSGRPKPRTSKEKQNEFLAKIAVIMIVASTFNILITLSGG